MKGYYLGDDPIEGISSEHNTYKVESWQTSTKFLSVSLGGRRTTFAIKFQTLGQMCYACGLIGYEHEECGVGLYDNKDLNYGDCIYANPAWF
jgi:hypothetical protein